MSKTSPLDSHKIKDFLEIADSRVTFQAGDYLFREGEIGTESFVILSGKVRISKLSRDGSEFSLRICSDNEICGELILFQEDARYFFDAKALTDCEVAIVRKEILEKEILNNPKVGLEFMIWLSNHIRKTMTRFWGLTSCGKKGSLYATLIRLANSFGVRDESGAILIDHPTTNTDLAEFCASTRETVNIFLNELKKEGIISIKKGKITIHNIKHLRNVMGCESCVAKYCSIN